MKSGKLLRVDTHTGAAMAIAIPAFSVSGGVGFGVHNHNHSQGYGAGGKGNHNAPACCPRGLNRGRKDETQWRSPFTVSATEGSAKSAASDDKIPAWARPGSDEPPPWARNEGKGGASDASEQTFQVPFYVYLLASAVVAIAAVGSMFEYYNQNPVFGVVKPDSVFYVPLLGFFVFTGLPASAFLWFKSIEVANKASEEQDRQDGYF